MMFARLYKYQDSITKNLTILVEMRNEGNISKESSRRIYLDNGTLNVVEGDTAKLVVVHAPTHCQFLPGRGLSFEFGTRGV